MEWKKSSRCAGNGACVQAATGPAYSRARASSGANGCVEATPETSGIVLLRDSKDAAGEDFPHLHFPAAEWDGGRAVKFRDVPLHFVPLRLRETATEHGHNPHDTWYAVSRDGEETGTMLYFDSVERDAWLAGVTAGEFAFEEVSA
jgi:hypothetical protein